MLATHPQRIKGGMPARLRRGVYLDRVHEEVTWFEAEIG
jgi:hypothetical protein